MWFRNHRRKPVKTTICQKPATRRHNLCLESYGYVNLNSIPAKSSYRGYWRMRTTGYFFAKYRIALCFFFDIFCKIPYRLHRKIAVCNFYVTETRKSPVNVQFQRSIGCCKPIFKSAPYFYLDNITINIYFAINFLLKYSKLTNEYTPPVLTI